MLYYSGNYLLLSYTIQSPKHFVLSLPNFRIDFINHEQLNFEFNLQSTIDDKNLCENMIMACEYSLGFFLNISLGASWSLSTGFQNNELSIKNGSEKTIPFNLLHHTIDPKTLKEITVPVQIDVNQSQLENFVLHLSQDDILSDATFYYLKAIDEPDQYFVLLYKAYEILKHTNIIPKKQASRFRMIANDPEVIFSRHAKPSSKLHGITLEDDSFCRQTIRNGILRYAEVLG